MSTEMHRGFATVLLILLAAPGCGNRPPVSGDSRVDGPAVDLPRGPDRRPKPPISCDDGLPCTKDIHVGVGICKNVVQRGWCVIGLRTGKIFDSGIHQTRFSCIRKGTRKPGNPCLACNPTEHDSGASGNTTWLPVDDGAACNDGNPCSYRDICVGGLCKGTWYAQQCTDGLACTRDLCDGQGGCLGHTLLSGWCLISGTCYRDGIKHPACCARCDTSKSTSGWTMYANHCCIDNRCYQPGTKHAMGCAECVPSVSQFAWTVRSGFCLIDNRCYRAGASNPSNSCLRCVPTTSPNGWTKVC